MVKGLHKLLRGHQYYLTIASKAQTRLDLAQCRLESQPLPLQSAGGIVSPYNSCSYPGIRFRTQMCYTRASGLCLASGEVQKPCLWALALVEKLEIWYAWCWVLPGGQNSTAVLYLPHPSFAVGAVFPTVCSAGMSPLPC